MLEPSQIKLEPVDIQLEPVDIKLEPVDVKQEPDPDSTTGNAPKKKPGRPKKMKQEMITDHVTVKKKRKVDRFKGMPEEEVIQRLLPDHLAPNLDIVIVGINPGLYAAFVGHHYAGPGNHFWKCLYLSGLIPEPMNAMQDVKLLEFGIGFTNIVARTTKGSADLSRKEIKEGATLLTEKLLKYKPKIAVFNGKGIYEVFAGHKNFHFGKQPDPLPGTNTAVYVMPSSSARCSQLPRAVDKVPFYEGLRKFRDHLIGKLPDLIESEITFVDVVLKTAVKKEVKLEGEDQYPGEMGMPTGNQFPDTGNQFPDTAGNQFPGTMGNMGAMGYQNLAQFMPGSYQVVPHSVPYSSQSQGFVNRSSPVNSPNPGPSPGISVPQPHLQVKQEPVDTDFSATSASGSCMTTNSQSETISFGQLEVYNQSRSSSQNDGHLNNFLNGLYGLVNQVASNNQSESKYGMVSHTAISTNGPVQFNDALRGIVRENSTDDVESCTSLDVMENPTTSQQSQGKPTKLGRPRKRKSKSAEESPPMSQASSSVPPSHDQHYSESSSVPPSHDQHYSESSSVPPSHDQHYSESSSVPPSHDQHYSESSSVPPSHDQHYSESSSSPPSNQSPSFQALQPVPPFTSQLPHQNMSAPTYSNAYMPPMHMQYNPPVGYSFMQPLPSFTQMMSNNGDQYMGMPPHANAQSFPHPLLGGGFPGQYSSTPGQPLNGFDPNLPIKQEKPDN